MNDVQFDIENYQLFDIERKSASFTQRSMVLAGSSSDRKSLVKPKESGGSISHRGEHCFPRLNQ